MPHLKPIPVAISARHVHLTREAVDVLFGKGYELTVLREISQPKQFACNETVTLVGPKNKIEHVRVLGPLRSAVQVEISRTDEFFLGIDAPLRDSGDTKGSAPIKLIGTSGELDISEGVIQARRHIHMHPDDAKYYDVEDGDVVEIALDTDGRDLIFGDVLIRVSPNYVLEMHVDTDEANAAELNKGDVGELIPTHGKGLLRKKVAS